LDIGVSLDFPEGETGVIDGTELRGPLTGGLVAVAMTLIGRDDDVAVDRVLTVGTACPEASIATTGEVVNALERVADLARTHVRGRDRFRTVDRMRQEGEIETRHTHVIGQIPQLSVRIRHTGDGKRIIRCTARGLGHPIGALLTSVLIVESRHVVVTAGAVIVSRHEPALRD